MSLCYDCIPGSKCVRCELEALRAKLAETEKERDEARASLEGSYAHADSIKTDLSAANAEIARLTNDAEKEKAAYRDVCAVMEKRAEQYREALSVPPSEAIDGPKRIRALREENERLKGEWQSDANRARMLAKEQHALRATVQRLEGEKEEAEAEIDRLVDAVDQCLPNYVLEDGTGDEANALERIEYAGKEIAEYAAELNGDGPVARKVERETREGFAILRKRAERAEATVQKMGEALKVARAELRNHTTFATGGTNTAAVEAIDEINTALAAGLEGT